MLFSPCIRIFWEGSHPPGWTEPGRYIYDCELVYVSSGVSSVYFENRNINISKGELLIIPPGIWHKTVVEKHARRHCVHFDWTPEHMHLHSPLQANSRPEYDRSLEHTPPAQFRKLLPLYQAVDPVAGIFLEELLRDMRNDSKAAAYRLWPLLCRICESSYAKSASNQPNCSRAVITVKEMIESRFREQLDYTDFCQAANLSKSRLCAIFSKSIGMAPVAYLNHVRLEQAMRMLLSQNMNISEIARSCGIADVNYFIRMFRKKYGCAPGKYLKKRDKSG